MSPRVPQPVKPSLLVEFVTHWQVAWSDEACALIMGEQALHELTGAVTRGPVGSATGLLFRQRPAVDFAQRWLSARATPDAAHAGGHDDTGPVDGG